MFYFISLLINEMKRLNSWTLSRDDEYKLAQVIHWAANKIVEQSIVNEEHLRTLEERERNRIKFEKEPIVHCWKPWRDPVDSTIQPMLIGSLQRTAEDGRDQARHLIATIKQRCYSTK
jgi:hypothetical protein